MRSRNYCLEIVNMATTSIEPICWTVYLSQDEVMKTLMVRSTLSLLSSTSQAIKPIEVYI